MNSRKRENKLCWKICSMLEPYDDWFGYIVSEKTKNNTKISIPLHTENDNLEAKKMLIKVHEEIKLVKPYKKYTYIHNSHTSYMRQIVFIRKAFEERKYFRVCYELITFARKDIILQKRVYYNLLYLLDNYLYN